MWVLHIQDITPPANFLPTKRHDPPDPLTSFINRNPTIAMLAPSLLLMIGMTLIADSFGFHVHKGIYAAMAFSALIEVLNMLSRRSRKRRTKLVVSPSTTRP